MSKASDRKRRQAAKLKFRQAEAAWAAAMRKARDEFWKFEAIKHPNGSRFAAGGDRAKHLRGYWDRIEEIAREKFGGKKPRALPFTGQLRTGKLQLGKLKLGHL